MECAHYHLSIDGSLSTPSPPKTSSQIITRPIRIFSSDLIPRGTSSSSPLDLDGLISSKGDAPVGVERRGGGGRDYGPRPCHGHLASHANVYRYRFDFSLCVARARDFSHKGHFVNNSHFRYPNAPQLFSFCSFVARDVPFALFNFVFAVSPLSKIRLCGLAYLVRGKKCTRLCLRFALSVATVAVVPNMLVMTIKHRTNISTCACARSCERTRLIARATKVCGLWPINLTGYIAGFYFK